MTLEFDYEPAIQKLTRMEAKIMNVQQQSLEIVADEIVKVAKSLAPVRTGHLRDSIGVLSEGQGTITVGATASYAGYVESGTVKMRARPFLHPALREEMAAYPDVFRRLWLTGSD